MKGIWFKVQYFLLSLWTLFVIEIVLTLDCSFLTSYPINWIFFLRANSIALGFFSLLLIDGYIWIRLRRRIIRAHMLPIRVTGVFEKTPDYLVFLTTIIMPLIAIEVTDLRSVLVLLILMVVIFLILVKTEQILANPTLAILGFRLYSIEHSSQKISSPIFMIAKEEIKISDLVSWLLVDSNLIWGRKALNDNNH